VRHPVEGRQAEGIERGGRQHDQRRAARYLMSGVQLFHLARDFVFDGGVALERRAGRHADLDEGELSPEVGPPRHEQVERGQPLRDAFRVVEPIHAEADERRLEREQFLEARGFGRQGRI
jgi:hypothetical protein